MPVLENEISTRLEILRTLYNLSEKQVGKEIKFYAAQISGGYYSEIHHQLRFLQERKLVCFDRNIVSKKFTASLTESGVAFMEDAYSAMALDDEIFSRIKM